MKYYRQYGWYYFVFPFVSFIGADEIIHSESIDSQSNNLRSEIHACSLICRGDIDAAEQILEDLESEHTDPVPRIRGIIADFRSVRVQREIDRMFLFQQKTSRLHDDLSSSTSDDPNTLRRSLVQIAETIEYADPEQRQILLSDPGVAHVIRMAIQYLNELDKRGHWNLAFEQYGRFLAVIDCKKYDHVVRDLHEKAILLQNLKEILREKPPTGNPVESDWIRCASTILGLKYIRPIEYRQLCNAALRQCRIITDVLQHTPNLNIDPSGKKRLAEWMIRIDCFQFEVEKSTDCFSKEQFEELLNRIIITNSTTIRIPHPLLMAQVLRGVFETLDPYTRIVWPDEATAFEEQIAQRYTGIGVNVIKSEDGLRVIDVIPNSPACKEDLRQDDRIVAINGDSTEEMSLPDAIGKITGPRGTEVRLMVKRMRAEQTEEIALEREPIAAVTVRGPTADLNSARRYWLEPQEGIAYIRITLFAEVTPAQMSEAMDILGPNVRGLVLDLRFNVGGTVTSAAQIADMFISKGLIVRCQGRFGPSTYYCADSEDRLADRPIVVLINQSSASAAEIVAGALQRTKPQRAVLVGEPTFGKTCVQTITPLSGGAFLKYTSANWFLSGHSPICLERTRTGDDPWRRHVTPDIEYRLTEKERHQVLTSRFLGGIEKQPVETAGSITQNGDRPIDTQLAIGLMVLKSLMIQAELKNDPRALSAAMPIAQLPEPVSAH